MENSAFFVFSLDTELATGYFDADAYRHQTFSTDGVRERLRIEKILGLCNTYGIHATWAMVGHLFFQTCEFCEPCGLMDWKGLYQSFSDAYGTSNPLWYGADIIRMIQSSEVSQEIGFHGYTHSIFTNEAMSDAKAALEISEWKRLADRFGIHGKSVVFPRNHAGHHSLLAAEGFSCFRDDDRPPLIIRNRYFGEFAEIIDHILAISTASFYPLEKKEVEGLIQIDSSAHMFALNRKADSYLDKVGLPYLRMKRITRGIHNAVKNNGYFHLWAHPWAFKTPADLDKLEMVFQLVHSLELQGKIRSITMGNLGDILRSISY